MTGKITEMWAWVVEYPSHERIPVFSQGHLFFPVVSSTKDRAEEFRPLIESMQKKINLPVKLVKFRQTDSAEYVGAQG